MYGDVIVMGYQYFWTKYNDSQIISLYILFVFIGKFMKIKQDTLKWS